jgi:hypothetical protein
MIEAGLIAQNSNAAISDFSIASRWEACDEVARGAGDHRPHAPSGIQGDRAIQKQGILIDVTNRLPPLAQLQ